MTQNQPGNGKGKGFFEVLFEAIGFAFGGLFIKTNARDDNEEFLTGEDIVEEELGGDDSQPNGKR